MNRHLMTGIWIGAVALLAAYSLVPILLALAVLLLREMTIDIKVLRTIWEVNPDTATDASENPEISKYEEEAIEIMIPPTGLMWEKRH